MVRDPLVALASSLHAGPKTFALLLGSGVSAGAGVPSAWGVARDLIKRFAVLQGENANDDPIGWYRAYADGEPDYSQLLRELAPSPVDRRNLLEQYFKPTADDQGNELRVPTEAHRAIARLVASRYVKVIVTTNFDRLLESALAEAGVAPTVISSPAHASGSLPIAHSYCTIVKVHGDYLSPDLKNTVDELARFDPEIDRLLDEVFDQYGLIVCGWSGVWDSALRQAILRAPSRRFASYWLYRDSLAPQAQEIIQHREAIPVVIQDADSVFEDLASKVEALAGAIEQQPLETAVAVAQLKMYLPDPVHRIKLHDLVLGECRNVVGRVEDIPIEETFTSELYAAQMRTYETVMARLLRLLIVGAFFSDRSDHDDLWRGCVELLASRRTEKSGLVVFLGLQQYPTLLALYGIGVGAVASERLESVAQVLGRIKVRAGSQSTPVAAAVSSDSVLDHNGIKKAIPSLARRKTPISDHLLNIMRTVAPDIFLEDERLEDIFDEVEYLLGLAHFAVNGYGPIGRTAWRHRLRGRLPGDLIGRHHEALIGTGLFTDLQQLTETRETYDETLRSARLW